MSGAINVVGTVCSGAGKGLLSTREAGVGLFLATAEKKVSDVT